jgi:hypothetical protein
VIFAEKSICLEVDDQRPENIGHLEGMVQRTEKLQIPVETGKPYDAERLIWSFLNLLPGFQPSAPKPEPFSSIGTLRPHHHPDRRSG